MPPHSWKCTHTYIWGCQKREEEKSLLILALTYMSIIIRSFSNIWACTQVSSQRSYIFQMYVHWITFWNINATCADVTFMTSDWNTCLLGGGTVKETKVFSFNSMKQQPNEIITISNAWTLNYFVMCHWNINVTCADVKFRASDKDTSVWRGSC